MGGGGGSSSSSSSSSTNTEDNRVGAEAGGIAVGAGGSFVNEFPEEARQAIEDSFSTLATFSSEVLQGGETLASEAINLAGDLALQSIGLASQTTGAATVSLATVAEREKAASTGFLIQDIVPLIAVGGGLFALYAFIQRGK